jgi:hypothetical protein
MIYFQHILLLDAHVLGRRYVPVSNTYRHAADEEQTSADSSRRQGLPQGVRDAEYL